jgi:hypothetical protein
VNVCSRLRVKAPGKLGCYSVVCELYWQLESATPLSNPSQSSVSAPKPAAALQPRQRAASLAHCAKSHAVPALPEQVPGKRLLKLPWQVLPTCLASLDSALAILFLESASMGLLRLVQLKNKKGRASLVDPDRTSACAVSQVMVAEDGRLKLRSSHVL